MDPRPLRLVSFIIYHTVSLSDHIFIRVYTRVCDTGSIRSN